MKVRDKVIAELENSLVALQETDTQIGHVWKMPAPYDSIRFAFTEVGEVVNDEINQSQQGYARNNRQQSPDMAKELADTGMMLLKYFMGQNENPKDALVQEAKILIDDEGTIYLPQDIQHIIEDAKRQNPDQKPPSKVNIIAMLVTYGMMMAESGAAVSRVNVILASALFLVVTHEVFKEMGFYEYLKQKLSKTIDKVKYRELHIS